MVRQTIHANDTERHQLNLLAQALKQGGVGLINQNGEPMEVPPSLETALAQVVEYLAEGKDIDVVSTDTMLTTQEVADILGMSRPYVISLAERGILSFTKVGTHRRFTLTDILTYKKELERRAKGLEELVRLSEEAHLYDE